MPAIWTSPKTWALTDVAEASIMNVQMRDNLLYLYNRPLDYYNFVPSVDVELSSLAWADLGSEYHLTLTTESGIINYRAMLHINGNSSVYFDVYIPEANVWLSSGTATKASNGLFYRRADAVNNDIQAIGDIVRDLGAADTYTFELWYLSGSATVIDLPANHANSLIVLEL